MFPRKAEKVFGGAGLSGGGVRCIVCVGHGQCVGLED